MWKRICSLVKLDVNPSAAKSLINSNTLFSLYYATKISKKSLFNIYRYIFVLTMNKWNIICECFVKFAELQYSFSTVTIILIAEVKAFTCGRNKYKKIIQNLYAGDARITFEVKTEINTINVLNEKLTWPRLLTLRFETLYFWCAGRQSVALNWNKLNHNIVISFSFSWTGVCVNDPKIRFDLSDRKWISIHISALMKRGIVLTSRKNSFHVISSEFLLERHSVVWLLPRN